MSSSQTRPPFFQAIEPRKWGPNRLYRVYALPDELVFIRAGSGGEISAALVAFGAHLGALGGLIAGLLSRLMSPEKRNRLKQQHLDEQDFDDLIAQDKTSFKLDFGHLLSAKFEPFSYRIAAAYHLPDHAGVIHLAQFDYKQLRLVVNTAEDFDLAFQMLSAALGHRLVDNRHLHVERSKLPARIVLSLLAAGVLAMWVFFFRFEPDNPRDFTTIRGQLASAKENRGRHLSLDLFLENSPIRYCVPSDGYEDYFDRQAFFAQVGHGTLVELTGRADQMANPHTPLLGSTPVVFVRGVRANGRDFCTVQDHIAWQWRNHWWFLGLNVAATGGVVFMAVRGRQRGRI